MHPTCPTRTTAEEESVVKFIILTQITGEKAPLSVSVDYNLWSGVQDMWITLRGVQTQLIQIRRVRNNNTQSNRQFPSVTTIDDDEDCEVDSGARGGPAKLSLESAIVRILDRTKNGTGVL